MPLVKSLAAAKRIRDQHLKKTLQVAHTTYVKSVRRGGKQVPAVIACVSSEATAAKLPRTLSDARGSVSVPLVVKISLPPRPEPVG